MNKICTSLEQSKKLIELGIEEDTSDMVYLKDYFLDDEEEEDDEEDYNLLVGSYHEGYAEMDDGSRIPLFVQHIPAWSLSALMYLLPEYVQVPPYLNQNKYVFNKNNGTIEFGDNYHTEKSTNPLDAIFEMIVWLKENGKI